MDKNTRLEILEKMSGLITAGLGLVAALAWNEAIKELFTVVFGQASGLIAMFVYAVVVTLVVVLATIRIGKVVNKLKGELDKDVE